jgi:hypothetical protein
MDQHEPVTNFHSGCTVVKPATSSVVSVCNDCTTSTAAPVTTEAPSEAPATETLATETPATEAPTTSESPVAPIAPYPSSNGTTPIVAPAPSGTGAPTESTSVAPFDSGASALTATGAGILAIFGLVAAL